MYDKGPPLLERFPVHYVHRHRGAPHIAESSAPDSYLDDFVGECLSRLSAEELGALVEFMVAMEPFSVGTFCAGTDAPVLVVQSIVRVLQHLCGRRITSTHLFSAELLHNKRQFIAAMHSVPNIFGDVCALSAGSAVNYASVPPSRVPVPLVRCCIGGFPCKDVSTLNTTRGAMGDVVERRGSKTGVAFGGITDYLRARNAAGDIDMDMPVLVLLENVMGLAMNVRGSPMSNLEACMRMLKDEAGAFSFAMALDAAFLGHSVSRPRLYLPVVPMRVLRNSGLDDAEFYTLVCDLADRLSTGHRQMPLESLLLDESHPVLTRRFQELESQQAERDRPKRMRREPKWPAQHADLALAQGRCWGASFDVMAWKAAFPGLLELSDRELDLLVLCDVTAPERPGRLLELGQSAARLRVATDATPCITPTFRGFLTSRFRLLTGVEALRCQGITFPAESLSRLTSFGNRMLLDLAGNAFHTGSCAVALVSSLVGLAVGRRRYRSALALSPPRSIDPRGAADGDSDLDSEELFEEIFG